MGDYAVIEVYEYSNFEQVAEFQARLGSIVHFADIVKEVVKYVHSKVGERIKLGIENNAIGGGVVDLLLDDDEFDYVPYIYKTKTKTREDYGIITGRNKDEMITYFYDYVTKDPTSLKSSELVSQLSVIERKYGGKIAAANGHHDDLFMASCFCAYLKKQCMLEIGPLIDVESEEYEAKQISSLQSLIGMNNTTNKIAGMPSKEYLRDINKFDSFLYGGPEPDDDDMFAEDGELPFWYSG